MIVTATRSSYIDRSRWISWMYCHAEDEAPEGYEKIPMGTTQPLGHRDNIMGACEAIDPEFNHRAVFWLSDGSKEEMAEYQALEAGIRKAISDRRAKAA